MHWEARQAVGGWRDAQDTPPAWGVCCKDAGFGPSAPSSPTTSALRALSDPRGCALSGRTHDQPPGPVGPGAGGAHRARQRSAGGQRTGGPSSADWLLHVRGAAGLPPPLPAAAAASPCMQRQLIRWACSCSSRGSRQQQSNHTPGHQCACWPVTHRRLPVGPCRRACACGFAPRFAPPSRPPCRPATARHPFTAGTRASIWRPTTLRPTWT